MIYLTFITVLFSFRYLLHGFSTLNRQIYPLIFILLFLVAAFRHEVGCDWFGYALQYETAGALSPDSLASRREPLWWYLLHYQSYFRVPYPWINVLTSTIFFAGMHVLACRQPDPIGFLVLLFPVLIVNMPMSGIRQGAAIGLICIAMARLLDGRALAYGLWVVLAAGFHSSALLFLLLLPLVSRKITKIRLFSVAILAVPSVIFLLESDAGQLASERYIDTNIEAFGGIFRILLLILSALYYLLFLRKSWRAEYPGDYQVITASTLATFALGGIFAVSSVIADRLAYYLMPAQAMIFARIPWLTGLRHRALLSVLPYLGLLTFFAIWSQLSSHFQQCYIPYDNWLFAAR